MRCFMILLEFIVFVPAVVKLLNWLYLHQPLQTRMIILMLVLHLPPLVYIDHGHFQPN